MTLNIREGVSLAPYNSFHLEAKAQFFAEAKTEGQIRAALAFARDKKLPVRILGGGSNLLITGDMDALVLHLQNHGRRLLQDSGGQVLVEAEAGEPWHEFVQWSLAQGCFGLENLSLIPGSVGAAPMQNIGAYGVELKDRCAAVDALDLHSGEIRSFAAKDCAFAYRDSRFKQEAGRWLILRVRFALSRQADLRLDYGALRARLAGMQIDAPTPADVSRAVCAIRREKLPDPAELGNAGSFFKNPLISGEQAANIRQSHADLVAWPQADGRVKLAAGWLIERAGFKGLREGDAGVHQAQSLVLVNHGKASGSDLLALARKIQQNIKTTFKVLLEIEPTIW